jgi:hypothetical protein
MRFTWLPKESLIDQVETPIVIESDFAVVEAAPSDWPFAKTAPTTTNEITSAKRFFFIA